ncbi:MAG: hypothetical protein ACTHY4_08280 [Flavobacteriaceae bacterium]
MKTILILTLSFVLFACNKDKNAAELEKTNLTEKSTINPENFSDLLHVDPDEKSLSDNKFKSSIDKGFLSNEEVYEVISSKHSLSENSKLTLLYYTLNNSKQKWIYRINSTRKLIIKNVKVFEAIKTENTDLNVERTIVEMNKVL